jgi:hypothetical protein
VYRAVRPPMPSGPAMGSWGEHWDRVLLGLARVERVYAGCPEPEGTQGAYYDVFTFFLICNALSDWIENDPAVKGSIQRKARGLVRSSHDLRVCADLANRTRHCSLTFAHTGDPTTGPAGNDVTVMLAEGARHALDLARSCEAAWRAFLRRQRLL